MVVVQRHSATEADHVSVHVCPRDKGDTRVGNDVSEERRTG